MTEPAPSGSYQLPFGHATVSPTTVVDAALNQNIRVEVGFNRSPRPFRALVIRLHRPGLPARRDRRREVEPYTVPAKTIDLAGVGAGSQRKVVFSRLNPPPGHYQLDFLARDEIGQLVRIRRGSIVVYAQHRLPPGLAGGASPGGLSRSMLPLSTRELVGGSVASSQINQNISNMAGNQGETFVSVSPNNPFRVMVGANDVTSYSNGFTDPQWMWISNDRMRPGTVIRDSLPFPSRISADEGGGAKDLYPVSDPALAADTNSDFWYAALTIDPDASNNEEACADPSLCYIVINRVASNAASFQPQNTAIPHLGYATLQDKPMITMDNSATSPKLGRLYAVWTEFDNGHRIVISECNTFSGLRRRAELCDDPDNWTTPAPTVVSDSSTATFAAVATARNGDVYVAWWNTASPLDRGNVIEIDRCLHSSNCRDPASWGADQIVEPLRSFPGHTAIPAHCLAVATPTRGIPVGPTAMDIDFNGIVRVAYSDLRNNGTTFCSAQATDASWDSYVKAGTAPNQFPPEFGGAVRLSDDPPGTLNDHFEPALSVDQGGNSVDASLYSTKHDPTREATHQYLVHSTDGGASFGAMQQITTEESNFSGSHSTGFDYGDYQGLGVVAGGSKSPAWTDNRASQGTDSDIYMLTEPPSGAVANLSNSSDVSIALTPGSAGSPGYYLGCKAHLTHQTGDNSITTRLYCLFDKPDITVNPATIPAPDTGADRCPPAPAVYCGDGLEGGSPPNWVSGGPANGNFGDVDATHAQLSGSANFYEPGTNLIHLDGCYPGIDNDFVGPNAYLKGAVNASSGQGVVDVWLSRSTCSDPGSDPPDFSNAAIRMDMHFDAYISESDQQDSDSDGCSDTQELRGSAGAGGLRDPFNPYDYFNPTRDRQNRIDDILAVVGRFGVAAPGPQGQGPYTDLRSSIPSAGYHPAFDRTGMAGGNRWNSGPPNGQVKVDDILVAVNQYAHDCAS